MTGFNPFLMGSLSVLYILAFAVSGFFIARLIFPKDRFLKQLMFGMTAGLIMLLWLPVLFAFPMKFTLGAQLCALAAALAAGALCLVFGGKKAKTGGFDKKKDIWLLATVTPLIIVGLVLMENHYIKTASDGSLHVGQCTYGDLCMHLGFITSISVQKAFPPMYSILPDTPLGYPFLCDSVSSTFYTLGSTLRFATLLPAFYAYITVALGVYLFFEDWFKRSSSACIGTLLLFVGGGFGFAYFFDNAKTYASLSTPDAWENWFREVYGINTSINWAESLDMGKRLMDGWYKMPTNYVDLGLRWVNAIADMLIPQRATLFGWALLFPALQMLRRAAFDREKRLFVILGAVAGAMPLVHTHSFFALGIISAALLIMLFIKQLVSGAGEREGWQNLGWFLLFGAVTMCFAAPQLFLFTFKQSSAGGFIKLHRNWCNESDSWLWFYIKNMGLIFILMLPAFLIAKREHKLFFASVLPIWLICEFVVFQPNTYDNNKLLFVWFAFTCGIVADLIVRVWSRLRRPDAPACASADDEAKKKKAPLTRRLACDFALGIVLAAMLASGVMTIAREYVSGDHYELEGLKSVYKEEGYQAVTPELVEAAEWIKKNTAPDDIILTATNHNNAVAMLTGRSIVCGSPTFLYFHGVDFAERYYRVQQMYEDPYGCFDGYAEEYGVDYVLISTWEMGSYNIDYSFFEGMETVWSSGSARLLKTN